MFIERQYKSAYNFGVSVENGIYGISRRDFLKFSGAAFGAIIANPLLKKIESEILFNQTTETESVNKVTFRKDSMIEVNGEPVFPLGLYYLPGSEAQSSWTKLKNAGFNIINQWWINEGTINEAEKNDIYTMAFLPYAFPRIDENYEVDKEILHRLRKSKSFIGYYGADEPDLTLKRPLHIASLRQLEELDPGRPDMTVFFEWPDRPISPSFDIREFKDDYQSNPEDLIGLPDFITVDDFKVWYLKNSGTEIVAFDYYDSSNIVGVDDITKKYVENLRNGKFGSGAKAVWVTLSAHSEIPRTLKSMRYQAIDVISRGATGILWWDWPPGCSTGACPGYPENGKGYSVNWENLQSIGCELDSVKKGLVGREVFLGVNRSGNIAYKVTRSTEGKHYVFSASNFEASEGPSKEKIQVFLRNKNFLALGENRIVTSDKDGYLEDNYGYLYARIFVQLVDMY